MPKDDIKLDLRTLGTSGLPVWGGRVFDEELDVLKDYRGRKIFRQMSEQDPIIGGVLLGIEMLARQVTWNMIPANDTEEAKKVADFVDEALSDMAPTFGNALSEILTFLIYGWSWLEIIYKRREGIQPDDPIRSSRFDDGKIGWGSWAIRSQETLDVWKLSDGDQGFVTGMVQWAPPKYEHHLIPRAKSLHFKTRSRRDNPEGISILRNAYRPWYMKNNIETIEGIGIERDLAGLPVLWAPEELFSATATAEQQALLATLKQIVTSIKRDEQEGILMPNAFMDDDGKQPSFKLELLATGGDRQFDTNNIVSRYDERIAMSMLADFILMGHQQVGSFALSTTKTGLFSTALSAILDIVGEEINAQAIPKLVLLNGWSLKLVPTLQHGKIDTADPAKLGTFLKMLFDAGMNVFPNQPLEKYLLEQAGLPADPGAGELPAPRAQEEDEEEEETTDDSDRTPDDEDEARPRAASDTKSKKAHASKSHHRHFTPLPVRVRKVQSKLAMLLDPDEYSNLLQEVMEYGKFSKLKQDYQDAILEAERSNT